MRKMMKMFLCLMLAAVLCPFAAAEEAALQQQMADLDAQIAQKEAELAELQRQRSETLVQLRLAQGGTLININILDSEKILAAHENPELYPDLVVRVTGFTAYFVSLSPKFRKLVVERYLEGI